MSCALRQIRQAALRSMERFLSKLSDRCSHGRVKGDHLLQSIYKTSAEMLHDRGVRVSSHCGDSDVLYRRVDAGQPVLRGALPSGAQVSVVIEKEERIGIKAARALAEQFPDDDFVLVSVDGPTPFCRREMPETLRLQYFSAKELMHNITRHRLVPRHRQLDETTTDEMLQRFSARRENLPLLLMSDPVRRYYNFAPDSVVEIVRTGVSHEASHYFRRVVA